jgi:hypothetical protein
MKYWESLVDKKIREAMEQGEFDDLEGKGEPLDTSVNPFEDPDLRLAHRILRNAGFAPSWIEERRDLDSESENARRRLSSAWSVLQNARDTIHESGAQARWQKALVLFREEAGELNRRIKVWNLKVPVAGFQTKLIEIDKVISEIEEPRDFDSGKK